MNTVMEQRPEGVPMSAACSVLQLNRSSVYWRLKDPGDKSLAKRSRKTAVQR